MRPATTVRALGQAAGLAAAVAVLVGIGDGALAPAGWTPTQLASWLDQAGPAVVALGAARLVALGAVTHIVASVVLCALATRTRSGPLDRLASAVALPVVRRAVRGGVGVGLTLWSVTGMARAAEPSAVAVMHQLDAGDDPSAPIDEATPSRPAPPPPATWQIAPGDHLWHVSARTLAAAWSREPSDPEVARYLDVVVAHNADRLVVPGQPDLVFTGQIFELPAVRPAP